MHLQRFANVAPDAALLQSLGVPAVRQVVLYAGNLGDKQGLESIVEAARLLADDTGLYFLVVGEGAGKVRMVAQARELGLANIGFAPLQPYEKLPALLASAACHLVVQKRGVADAVLPSKFTNILAVGGNAVITADSDTTLGRLCDEFPGVAMRIEPESAKALVEGIRRALAMPLPNTVARDYARRCLDKEDILGRFEGEVVRAGFSFVSEMACGHFRPTALRASPEATTTPDFLIFWTILNKDFGPYGQFLIAILKEGDNGQIYKTQGTSAFGAVR